MRKRRLYIISSTIAALFLCLILIGGIGRVALAADASNHNETSEETTQSLSADSNRELFYTPVSLPCKETGTLSSDDGLSVRGSYGKGYSFYGEIGQNVVITMTSQNIDSYLYLLDDSESILSDDDDGAGGSNAQIALTLPYTGTYYIQATEYSIWPGSFEMTIRTAESLEINYRPVSLPHYEAATLSDEDGLSLRGSYGKGYSFFAEIGQQVIITLTSNDFDAYLYLLDDYQNELTRDDDGAGGGNSRVVFTIQYTGFYYVQATQFSVGIGNFEISIETVEYAELHYTHVALPFSESAMLSNEDWWSLRETYAKGYSFYAEAGQQAIITLVSDDFVPRLYLLNNIKISIKASGANDGSISKIEHILPYTGTYYIQATQTAPMIGNFKILIEIAEAKPIEAPNFITQPANMIIAEGRFARFSVAMADSQHITFQWQVSEDSGNCWDNIPNATGETLTLGRVSIDMDCNQYRCMAVNGIDISTVSNAAILFVTHPPDDGIVNPCDSLEELLFLLSDETVGFITLQANITIDLPTSFPANHPVTIEMGDHSIIVEKWLFMYENLRFEGNGDVQPLFQITSGYVYGGGATIVARNDDAIAVNENGWHSIGQSQGTPFTIIANGKNAAGILADNASVYSMLHIIAAGVGGVGIRLENTTDVSIEYCIIEAGFEAIAGCDNIKLIASEVFPEPPGAITYDTLAFWPEQNDWLGGYNLLQYGYSILLGGPLVLPDEMEISIMILDGDLYNYSVSVMARLTWEYDSEILFTPGVHWISVTPSLPFPEIALPNLEHGKKMMVPVHVLEDSRQHLSYLKIVNQTYDSAEINIKAFLPLDEETEYILWIKEDAGEWVAYGNVYFQTWIWDQWIRVYGLDLTKKHEIILETLDGPYKGMSNALYLPIGAEFLLGYGGGDRDGTGQGDQGENRPSVDPPPNPPGDTKLPDTGRDSGGSDNPPASGNGSTTVENDGSPADSMKEKSDEAGAPNQAEQAELVEIEFMPPPLGEETPAAQDTFAAEQLTVPPDQPDAAINQPTMPHITLDAVGLDDLREAQPLEMTFIKNDVKLVIPTSLLDGLVLGEGQVFVAELETDGKHFTVRLYAGEREISGFSGETFLVYIPYDANVPLSALYCEDEQGNRFYAESREGRRVLFRLSATGSYAIHEEMGTDEQGGAAITERNEPSGFTRVIEPQQLSGQEVQNNPVLPWGMIGIAGGVVLVPTATLGIRYRIKTRVKRG